MDGWMDGKQAYHCKGSASLKKDTVQNYTISRLLHPGSGIGLYNGENAAIQTHVCVMFIVCVMFMRRYGCVVGDAQRNCWCD